MLEAKEDLDLQNLLDSDEYSFRYDIGISQPSHTLSLVDKHKIVTLMAKYFTVLRVKSELDQLVCGLSSTLNVLDLVRKNSLQMKELFLYHDPPPLTWESVYNLFPAQMSTEGSTKREREEAVMMRWINVITCIEGNLLLQYCILLYCIIVASSGLVEIKDHTTNEIYSL